MVEAREGAGGADQALVCGSKSITNLISRSFWGRLQQFKEKEALTLREEVPPTLAASFPGLGSRSR